MASLTPRIDDLERNYIRNGAMAVAQRGTSWTGATGSIGYTMDRWATEGNSSSVFNITQDSNAPSPISSGFTGNTSYKIAITTADAVVDSNNYLILQYAMEGNDFSNLKNKKCILSFWVNTNKAGTYCTIFRNSTGARSFVYENVITSGDLNTWKQIKVPVSFDTDGTWLSGNNLACLISFVFVAGTNFHGTNNVWNTANKLGTANQVNFADSTSNVFYMTQVMLKPVSDNAIANDCHFTGFAPSYDGELRACQRYFEKSYDIGTAIGAINGSGNIISRVISNGNTTTVSGAFFKVQKRTAAIITIYGGSTGTINKITQYGGSDQAGTASANNAGTTGFEAVIGNTGLTDSVPYYYGWTATAEL